jgi:hypothetical protein
MVDEVLPAPKRQVSAVIAQRASNEVPGRTLGPIVAMFDDLHTAWRRCKRMGREYSVTGTADGWCIRKWVDA